MDLWKCSICGYVHMGSEAPHKCPNCQAPKEKFVEIQEDPDNIHISYTEKLSTGHEVAINTFFENYEFLAPYIYNIPVGEEVKLHKHPTTDEIFYIIKGKLQFRVDMETLIALPGDIIKAKMNTPHAFKNIGEEHAAFLSVKAPKPVDLEMMEE